jgi:hypothetical protein
VGSPRDWDHLKEKQNVEEKAPSVSEEGHKAGKQTKHGTHNKGSTHPLRTFLHLPLHPTKILT